MHTLHNLKTVAFWLSRISLAALVLLVYFAAWRPLRVALAQNAVIPAVQSLAEGSASVDDIEVEGREMVLYYPYGAGEKKLTYAPQAGFFFLVAVVGLLFVTLDWRWYAGLLLFHLCVEILAWGALWIGLQWSEAGFMFADFLIAYFSPVVSLAFVPLLFRYLETADGRRQK